MAYKKLIKVSNVCQLLDKSKYNPSQTINGVTFTNNGDGSITVNGTATEYTAYHLQYSQYFSYNLIGHICLIESNLSLPSGNTITIHTSNWDITDRRPIGKITSVFSIWISVYKGYTANNLVFKPQLFDLTEMYGAGHEPTTVEQFRQDFPEEMYDYSPHCWLTSYKRVILTGEGNYLTTYQRNLTCKTKNLFDMNFYLKLTNSNIIINGNSIFCVATNKNASVSYKIPTVIGEKYTVSNKSFVRGGLVSVDYGLFLSDKLDRNGSPYLVNGLQSGQSFTLTASSEFLYIHCWVCYGFDSNNPSTIEIDELQVNLGDTATDYVPYGHL